MNYIIAILGAFCIFAVLKLGRRVMLARCHMAFSVHVADGDLEEAKYYFRRLLVWSPAQFGRNPTIMLGLFNVRYLDSSLPNERLLAFFEALASEALAQAPRSPYPYLMAAGLASQRQPGGDTCRDYLAQALSASHSSLEIYRRAGDVQLEAGMYREAERYYLTMKHIAALGRSETGVLAANTALVCLYSQIEALAPRSGKSRTIDFADLVLKSEKDETDRAKICLIKANEFARFDNFPRAVEILREEYSACTLHGAAPGAVILIHPLITALLHEEQLDNAEQVIQIAAEIGVANLDVERARVAWKRQRREEAKKLLRGALESGDGTVANTVRAAQTYLEWGNLSMATALLEQASRQDPDDYSAGGSICSPEVNAVMFNQTTFFPFIGNAFGAGSVTSELASCYAEQGRFAECADEWKRLARKDKNNPIPLVFWAQALERDGRHKEAAKLFREAEPRLLQLLVEAPHYALFHYAMGIICQHDGDTAEAAFHYSMVVGVPCADKAARALHEIKESGGYSSRDIMTRIADLDGDSEARSRLASFAAAHPQDSAEVSD